MPFRPSETLKAIADYAFIICGTILMIVSAVLLWQCEGFACQPGQRWISHTFAVMCIATGISWLFRFTVVWHDLDAKAESGIIKRRKYERIGHHWSTPKALNRLNKGDKLNAWYLTGYATAHVLVECIRLVDAPRWLWIPAILCFGIPEVHGIYLKKHTFSQAMRVFLGTGSQARRIMMYAWIAWLFFVVMEASGLPKFSIYVVPIAELCLIGGAVMWLIFGSSPAISWRRPW